MSRSFNEHHKMVKNEKQPSTYLDKECKKLRHRKIKPYGIEGYDEFGGFSKYSGEYSIDVVKKKKARRDAKKQIIKEINDEF